jgi:hypothetical protein
MLLIPDELGVCVLGDWVNSDVCVETMPVAGDIGVEVKPLVVMEVVEETEEALLAVASWLVVVVATVAADVIGTASMALQAAPFQPLWYN